MLPERHIRALACTWHDGPGSRLYQLCLTGEIKRGILREIRDALPGHLDYPGSARDCSRLLRLLDEIRRIGSRPAVPGWGTPGTPEEPRWDPPLGCTRRTASQRT